jgi:hypothetical protein
MFDDEKGPIHGILYLPQYEIALFSFMNLSLLQISYPGRKITLIANRLQNLLSEIVIKCYNVPPLLA